MSKIKKTYSINNKVLGSIEELEQEELVIQVSDKEVDLQEVYAAGDGGPYSDNIDVNTNY